MGHYSLNEVEKSLQKAARGAGMPWGLAEEVGKAVRWLAAHELPSVSLAVPYLLTTDFKKSDALVLQLEGRNWTHMGEALCPIVTGAAINDRAESLAAGDPWHLGPTRSPLLLLAILGRLATSTGASYRVAWEDVGILLLPAGPVLEASDKALNTTQVDHVTITAYKPDGSENPQSARVEGTEVADDVWREVNRLAHRTYVPATEESRLRGAGAGVVDTD